MTEIDARLREAYDSERLREAYDSERLPDGVRVRTLAAIEEARKKEAVRGVVAASAEESAAQSPTGVSSAAPVSGRTPRARRRSWRGALPVAACLIMLLALVGVFGFYQTPVAYVSISVNPSLELTVNSWGTVIGARGLNEDGETVIAEVPLDHLSYEEAIDRLVASPAFSPYLTAEALVDVDITSDDAALGDAIAEQTDRVLAKTPCEHRCHRADDTTCGAGDGAEAGQGHGWGGRHHGNGHGAGNSAD